MAELQHKPLIGYLSPEGRLSRCTSWGQSDCAEKIAKKIGYTSSYACRVFSEEYILDRGYVCLRQRDAFCSYYVSDRYKQENGYSEGTCVINLLTKAQINFINKHNKIGDWASAEQANDINNILEYQEKLGRMVGEPDVVVNKRGR